MIDLGCDVLDIEVNPAKGEAIVYVPELHCTDMGATTSFFERLDPRIRSVIVAWVLDLSGSGDVAIPDSAYRRGTEGGWEAILYEKKRPEDLS